MTLDILSHGKGYKGVLQGIYRHITHIYLNLQLTQYVYQCSSLVQLYTNCDGYNYVYIAALHSQSIVLSMDDLITSITI